MSKFYGTIKSVRHGHNKIMLRLHQKGGAYRARAAGRVFLKCSLRVLMCSVFSENVVGRSPTSIRLPWLYLTEMFLARLDAYDAERRSRTPKSDMMLVSK